MKKIFINFILLVVATIIFAILVIPAFVFGTYHKAWTGGFSGLRKYIAGIFITFAEDIDRSGNYIAGSLLNHLFISKAGAFDHYQNVSLFEYPEFCKTYHADLLFGNIRETISSVLGKNEEIGNLTGAGRVLCAILNFIEEGHCRKSIKWYEILEDHE